MEMYPDAKVILSVRSNGEAWADSVLSTIGAMGPHIMGKPPFVFTSFYKGFMKNLYPYIWERIGLAPIGTIDCSKPFDRDALIKAYHEWNDEIKATVPEDKLLVHEAKDGFRPICKFIGIPEEETPKEYPHLNDTAKFLKMVRFIKMLPYIFYSIILIIVCLGIFLAVYSA